MKKYEIIVILNVFFIILLSGCKRNVGETETYRSLDYTLVEYKNIPQKLVEEMETRMDEGFEITYEENEYLYIAKGYGKQDKSGGDVVVDQLYSDGTNIIFTTSLLGKTENSGETEYGSRPFIVVKTEGEIGKVLFR